MAVPKRKTTRSRAGKRRSHIKFSSKNIIEDNKSGEYRLSHHLDLNGKNQIFNEYLNVNNKSLILSQYFENYRSYLKKNTFNSLLKGVIKPKF